MDIAEMTTIPNCDIHEDHGIQVPASYDSPTVFGPWAYLCESCFIEHRKPDYATKLVLATA